MTIRAAAAFAIAISIFASTAHAATPGPDDMSAQCQANKAGAVGFMQTVFVDHKVAEAFSKYVAADFREHRPLGTPTAPTRASVMAGLTREFAGGGGPTFRPISAVAEGDMVFVRSSNGDVDAYRIRNGKIVEHWDGATKPTK